MATGGRGRRVFRLGSAALLVVGLAGAAPRAGAQDRSVTRAEAAALAADALDDPRALSDLEAVQRIDGHRVDLAAALDGRSDAERRVRLRQLATELGRGSAGVDASRARRDAHEVVTSSRYQKRSLPAPFRGPLQWIADRLRPVFRWLGDRFDPIWSFLGLIPGGQFLFLLLVVAAVTVPIALAVARRSGARIRHSDAPGAYVLAGAEADPEELRRRAEAAEAAGDLDEALHLLFAEGVSRLARAGRLRLRPETTASAVANTVGGATVHGLVRDFEEVVYGGRPATVDDLARAKAGWPALLDAAVAR